MVIIFRPSVCVFSQQIFIEHMLCAENRSAGRCPVGQGTHKSLPSSSSQPDRETKQVRPQMSSGHEWEALTTV